ncbi:DUF481 domain-containing protein [Gilvimarinus sp. DZF01]|uniref:DUF481 domain-containing protein n=1 Tax=Gilvimarinus sp. DZF01 TaxID=3461371 RepID=UPI004045CE55
MKARRALVFVSATSALIPFALHAQDVRPYDASISLGYVGTTGNTESQTFETQMLYTRRNENWVHSLEFQGLYTEQESVTNGERYFAQGKSDFQISDDDYLFGKLSYTDDRFTGFDYQAKASVGYGHYFFNRDDLMLETYAGLGYRHNAYVIEEDEGEAILTLGERLDWAFSDSASMTQSLTSEIGEDLTVSKFEIGLVSTLIGQLATKIAFQARHISDVPPDRENTDTQTSVSLVYEF